MEQKHLKLKEIIWEITNQCKNNCTYCGSKETVNQELINEKDILAIASEIAKYPPREVNISGGDPLLLDFELHEKITKLFRENDIKSKIIINPKSLVNGSREFNYYFTLLSLYDWIGISINDNEELACFKKFLDSYDKPFGSTFENYTVITNFNVVNLYDYNIFEEFVETQKVSWMIQFTVFKGVNSLSIYNNNSALHYLQNSINNSLTKGIRILISDNANSFPCSAGKYSLGILANGEVIPCLSMLAWQKELPSSEGNLLTTSLKEIWENCFKTQRFNTFACCKDACNRASLNNVKITIITLKEEQEISTESPLIPGGWKEVIPNYPRPLDDHLTMMYGVRF